MNNIAAKNVKLGEKSQNAMPYLVPAYVQNKRVTDNLNSVLINNAFRQLLDNDLYIENRLAAESVYRAGPKTNDPAAVKAAPDGYKYWGSPLEQDVTVYRKIDEPLSSTVEPSSGLVGEDVKFIAEYNGFYFAGTSSGLAASRDASEWQIMNADADGGPLGAVLNYCKNDQFMLFCGDYGVYWLSSREEEGEGEHAQYRHELVRLNANDFGRARCAAWKEFDGTLFVGTDDGVYSAEMLVRGLTPRAGKSLLFEANAVPSGSGRVNDIAVAEEVESSPDQNVLVATEDGLLGSSKSVGFAGSSAGGELELNGVTVYDAAAFGDYVFYATGSGIYRSDDMSAPFVPTPARTLRASESGRLYAGCAGGVYDVMAGQCVYYLPDMDDVTYISPRICVQQDGSKSYDVHFAVAGSTVYTFTADPETCTGDMIENESFSGLGLRQAKARGTDMLVLCRSTLYALTSTGTAQSQDSGRIAVFNQVESAEVSQVNRVFQLGDNLVYGVSESENLYELYKFNSGNKEFEATGILAAGQILGICAVPGGVKVKSESGSTVPGLDLAVITSGKISLYQSDAPETSAEIALSEPAVGDVCYFSCTLAYRTADKVVYFKIDADGVTTEYNLNVVADGIASDGEDSEYLYVYSKAGGGTVRRYKYSDPDAGTELVPDESFEVVADVSSMFSQAGNVFVVQENVVCSLPTGDPVVSPQGDAQDVFMTAKSPASAIVRIAGGRYEGCSAGAAYGIDQVTADGMPISQRGIDWAFYEETDGISTAYYKIGSALYTDQKAKSYRLDTAADPVEICKIGGAGLEYASRFESFASSQSNEMAYLMYVRDGKCRVRTVDVRPSAGAGRAPGAEVEFYVDDGGELKHVNEDSGYDMQGVFYLNNDCTDDFFVLANDKVWVSSGRSARHMQQADVGVSSPIRATKNKFGCYVFGEDGGVFSFIRFGMSYGFYRVDGTAGAQFKKLAKRADFQYFAATDSGLYSVILQEERGEEEERALGVAAYKTVEAGDFDCVSRAKAEDGSDVFLYAIGNGVYQTVNFRRPASEELLFSVPSGVRVSDALRKNRRIYYAAASNGLYSTGYAYRVAVDNPRFTATSAQALYDKMGEDLSSYVSAGADLHVLADHNALTSGIEWLNANAMGPDFETEPAGRSGPDANLSDWTAVASSGDLLSAVNDLPEYIWFGDQSDGDLTATISNFTVAEPSAVGLSYVAKRYNSGVTELYVYIPTTRTYYVGHIPGSEGCAVSAEALVPRKNLDGVVLDTKISSSLAYSTEIDLAVLSTLYAIDGGQLFDVQVNGNSLPLKIYRDEAYVGLEGQGGQYYHSYVEPSFAKSSSADADELGYQHCRFTCFGSDAQAIRLSFYDSVRRRPEDTLRIVFDPNGGQSEMPGQRITADGEFKLRPNSFKRADCIFMGWSVGYAPQDNQLEYVKFEDQAAVSLALLRAAGYKQRLGGKVTLYATWLRHSFSSESTELEMDSGAQAFSMSRLRAEPGETGMVVVDFGD